MEPILKKIHYDKIIYNIFPTLCPKLEFVTIQGYKLSRDIYNIIKLAGTQ
jgi:hypothetical protein